MSSPEPLAANKESCAVPSLYIQAARAAAEAANTVIRKAYRGNFKVSYKADASPVTEVDIAAERAIKASLQAQFPQHGFYGEELGWEKGGRESADAEYLWLIDPIDGTKAFVRGYPLFSVQIALMHRGELIAGVSSAPEWNGGSGELVWAEKGQGAWLGDERLQVASTSAIERATLSTGNLARLARSEAWARLGNLIPRLHRIRGYGDFLHYHWLAAAKLDAVIESDVNILDIAALSVIVHEAGGIFTDLEGKALTLDSSSVLAATPALHAQLLRELNYRPPA
ncbi:MAG: inositol-phosphate phosphatase [Nevskia sp.]|nr:inositol-phosphate phosphatase [Nevskia sp.]